MEDRLQKFARLTEIGNFTKTARILHISQPALSMAIDKLEQELGTELLVRGNRKLDITPAGKVAYTAALEHQQTTDNLRGELNQIAKRRPVVTIGMTDSIAVVLCASEAFDKLEQEANVTVVVNNSRYLREAVKQRQLDLAFIIDDGAEHPPLITRPAGTEELVFVCHPDLLADTEKSLGRGQLQNFICYDKPSTTYRHIQQALQAQGIRPHVSLFSTSPDVMLSMALRAKGVSALPQLLVDEPIHQSRLVHPKHNGVVLSVQRPVQLITQPGKVLPACAQFLLKVTI